MTTFIISLTSFRFSTKKLDLLVNLLLIWSFPHLKCLVCKLDYNLTRELHVTEYSIDLQKFPIVYASNTPELSIQSFIDWFIIYLCSIASHLDSWTPTNTLTSGRFVYTESNKPKINSMYKRIYRELFVLRKRYLLDSPRGENIESQLREQTKILIRDFLLGHSANRFSSIHCWGGLVIWFLFACASRFCWPFLLKFSQLFLRTIDLYSLPLKKSSLEFLCIKHSSTDSDVRLSFILVT